MQIRLLGALIVCSGLVAAQARADDKILHWINHIDQPEVQQKVLSLIFPGQVGSVSEMKQGKRGYAFPKGGEWVQMGSSVIWSSATTAGLSPYALITCFLSRAPEADPINASSYKVTSANSRPMAISGGYATYERLEKLEFPGLKKSFVAVWNLSVGKGPNQRSAALLELGPDGPLRNQAVWTSPSNVRNFELAIHGLGGQTEYLLIRIPGSDYSSGYHYRAYRWNGSRFELDDLVFESRLEALPADVWGKP